MYHELLFCCGMFLASVISRLPIWVLFPGLIVAQMFYSVI